jgi:amino-acid N-acetyltransferase
LKTTAAVRKATGKDIDTIHEIIASYSEDGILLARSLDDISNTLENFYVAEMNSFVVGAITFYDYGDHLKEVRSLAVRKNYLRRGIGSTLLQRLIQDLMSANMPKIFVLTYTPAFFERNGFTVIDTETLPEKIWKDCIYCKNQDACHETALEYRGIQQKSIVS